MIANLMKRRQRKILAGVKPIAQKRIGEDAPEDEPTYKPLEWPVIKKGLLLLKPFKYRYALATFIGLVTTLLEMIAPQYIQHLVDHDLPQGAKYGPHFLGRGIVAGLQLFGGSAAAAAKNIFEAPGRQPYWNICFTILLWGLTTTVAILLQRFWIRFARETGERVIFGLRKSVFAHLQRLSMSFYDRTKFGRIYTRGTSDIDALVGPVVNGVNTTVTLIATLLIASVLMIIIDWRIAVSVLWLGPVLYFTNIAYRNKVGLRYRIARESYTRVSTNLAENISGMRVVSAYNRQADNLLAFNQLQDDNTINNVNAAHVNGIYLPLLGVVGFVGRMIILVLGCYLIFVTTGAPSSKPFTVGMLLAELIYWEWFMGPVLGFGNFYNELMVAMASAERLFALLEQQPDVMDRPNATTLPAIRGDVTFDHVNFGYDPKKPVLHDICFEAKAGQTIALVGHTGCGKSTIMNLLCRFYLPQSGAVLLDGHDLSNVTGESLHQQMGIVSQSNYLFSGTVLDNIRYARPQSTEEEVIAAAKALGSHDILTKLKDGYHSQVGERGNAMSLGQRQLICFTRAFLANPRILMLDEATSAVDTHTEMIIQQALERLVADRTTFIVAHRLSTVMHADEVIVLDHGHIIERGTHATLLALNGKYAELYKQFTREI